MTAGQMAGFVRQHPDDLVRRLRLHQGAVIDEDTVTVGDEGVEYRLVDNGDLDILFLKARSAQDRLGVVAQQLLGLRVAQDRQALWLFGERDRRPTARAIAVAIAVILVVFRKRAKWSNIKRSLSIGGGSYMP